MRGDTSDNNLRAEEHVEAETTSGERRPSVVALQNMLKRVSQSPFSNQHMQDAANGTPARKNPFYDYYLQSGSNGHQNDDTGTKASQGVDMDPKSQSSASVQWPEPQADSQTATVGQNATANGHSLNATVDTSDIFRTSPVDRTSEGSELFRPGVEDLFRPADPFGGSRSVSADPFKPGKDDDLFRFPQPVVGNPFRTASTGGADLFQTAPTKSEELFPNNQRNQDVGTERDLFAPVSNIKGDPFSTSSTDTVDPFQSPITKNLFEDVSSFDDPFGPTPAKHNDPFQQDIWSGTPDIFQPLVPKSLGLSEVTPSSAASEASYSTPSVSSPEETPDLFKKTPSKAAPPPVPPKPSPKPPAVVLTSPGDTEHEILPPTPFSRTRNLAMSSVRASTLKRPPKPLPRTKPPKPERPPQPTVPVEPEPSVPKGLPKPVFKPLPKPVLRLKPKTPEGKKVKPEDFVVFEDILLIGQEHCVEDWPEDSPEVHPQFKPSGKLRLRRESLTAQMKLDADGASGEELDVSEGSSKKKDKKIKMSLLTRRSSKEKFPDEMEARSRTVPLRRKPSKDGFPDLHMSAGEIEDDDQVDLDYKKKPLKTKVNQLLRRASTNSAMLQGKQANGQSPPDWRDDGIVKKKVNKKDSMRRWSEGTALDGSTGEDEEGGDIQKGEKKHKKLKIKFVPRRGYTITSDKISDEPKGASGYTPRKGSKADMLDEAYPQKMKGACSAEELDGDEFYQMDDCKQGGFVEDELTGRDFCSPKETFDSEQDEETCKPKKHLKLKGFKKKSMNDSFDFEGEIPQGATSGDFLSEAAQAEWYAAQKDAKGMEDEDEDEDGDTDSLMEWWNTVEQWDEVPSDEEENFIKEDESKSFGVLADKVQRGLRVFNKVFTERAEVLWQSVITIFSIADDISDFHQKAKIAGITGGTTTAVGGVTAIAGLALAPFTLGASLVITAVGVGVATAGGIASASAAISDNVNNMNDRKKVEAVLEDYEGHLLDIGKILHFINQGLYKLRGHPFLRSGTQHYSEDWETRRAVQMISQVDSPVMRATEITDGALASLQALFKGMDKYFIKDSRELKKGCRKEVVAQIRELANILNDAVVDLNAIREELQEATGNM